MMAAHRTKDTGGLTHAQQLALLAIWQSEGIDSFGYLYRNRQTIGRIDVRTLISLVARGLLQGGRSRRIVVTEEGNILAHQLRASRPVKEASYARA
jgi:hypothetical protein